MRLALPRAAAPAALAVAALSLSLGGAPRAGAEAGAYVPADGATTMLLSRALGGGLPNAPSLDPAISRDNRIGRVAAYDSAATNIVAQPTGGVRNVYVVTRGGPYEGGPHPIGTVWHYGQTTLASTGLGGGPANGASWAPALDGDAQRAPSCVAFISSASNLVPGDTNGQPDAFVRSLRTGKITRVSVGANGQQANGATYEVAVNGDCTRVAFVSDAGNLALTHTSRAAWRAAVTSAPPAGVREVYVRQIGVGENARLDRRLLGLTFLASARDGRPGRGASGQLSFARDGEALAFTSTAANLGGDPAPSPAGGATSQVYERLLLAGWVGGHDVLELGSRLLSATPSGRAGNGPSGRPSIGQDGSAVAFQTLASDLMAGCANGHWQVIERTGIRSGPARDHCASRSRARGVGAGDSVDPEMTDAGQDVYFDTDAANLQPLGRQGSFSYPGARDVVGWDSKMNDIRLIESLAWNNVPSQLPATMGAASSRGNYLIFSSTDADEDPLDTGVTSLSLQVPVGCGGAGKPVCPPARNAASSSLLSLPTVPLDIPGLGSVAVTGVTVFDGNAASPEAVATTAPTRTITLTPEQASLPEQELGAVIPVPSSEQLYLRYVGPNVH
jgi:hypothetical protein